LYTQRKIGKDEYGLAELLSKDPSVEDLTNFYLSSNTLQIESAENDPYSFVF
jgi:hypothetical protein